MGTGTLAANTETLGPITDLLMHILGLLILILTSSGR